jgi:hypothetical protein
MSLYDSKFSPITSLRTPKHELPDLSSLAYDYSNDRLITMTRHDTTLTISQYDLAAATFLEWVQITNVDTRLPSQCFVASQYHAIVCVYATTQGSYNASIFRDMSLFSGLKIELKSNQTDFEKILLQDEKGYLNILLCSRGSSWLFRFDDQTYFRSTEIKPVVFRALPIILQQNTDTFFIVSEARNEHYLARIDKEKFTSANWVLPSGLETDEINLSSFFFKNSLFIMYAVDRRKLVLQILQGPNFNTIIKTEIPGMQLDSLTSSKLVFLDSNRGVVLACDHRRAIMTRFSVDSNLALTQVVKEMEIPGNYTDTQATLVNLEGKEDFAYLLQLNSGVIQATRVTASSATKFNINMPNMGMVTTGMGVTTRSGDYLILATSTGMIYRTNTVEHSYDALYRRGTLACGTYDNGVAYFRKIVILYVTYTFQWFMILTVQIS